MTAPVFKIKRPPAHWERIAGHPQHGREGVETWVYSGFTVTSQLAGMEAPDGSHDVIPTWLMVVSRRGKRATDDDVKRALRAFSMEEALEDNHHPGVGRAFFLPVDPGRRRDCECKLGEALVTDPDGYQWSNDTAGECRGCEYERTYGKPCPIHKAPAAEATP
jgi:hypothetical protein